MSYNVKKEKQNAIPERKEFPTFEDLDVYQEAREFRKKMYAVTRRLLDFEKYDLGSQIRRAAVSLTDNIAEGHGRYHFADQVRFFLGSRGSLQELMDDLNVCADENYLEAEKIEAMQDIDTVNIASTASLGCFSSCPCAHGTVRPRAGGSCLASVTSVVMHTPGPASGFRPRKIWLMSSTSFRTKRNKS